MQWKCFVWQRGTLQLIAIHLITLHNILEYLQITIIQTEAAEFVDIYSQNIATLFPKMLTLFSKYYSCSTTTHYFFLFYYSSLQKCAGIPFKLYFLFDTWEPNRKSNFYVHYVITHFICNKSIDGNTSLVGTFAYCFYADFRIFA
jgi:hypothetical protein